MAFIGLVGCGNLGSLIIDRILSNGGDPKLIKVLDRNKEKIQNFKIEPSNFREISSVDVLILAVKPWNVHEVLEQLKPEPETIILSMAAGISLKKLEGLCPEKQPICRVMPNAGIKMGSGVLVIAFNQYVEAVHKESIKEVLEPLGSTIELKEESFNAVTSLIGSGPAFISHILSGFILGGISAGLRKEIAEELTLKTFESTIKLIKSGVGLEELVYLVSSPAGTTMTGLEKLETEGVKGQIIRAIRTSSERAFVLGRKKELDEE